MALRWEYLTKLPDIGLSTDIPAKREKTELSSGFLAKQAHLAVRSDFWTKQEKSAVRQGFPAKPPNLELSWEEQPKRGLTPGNIEQHTTLKITRPKSAQHQLICYVENNVKNF